MSEPDGTIPNPYARTCLRCLHLLLDWGSERMGGGSAGFISCRAKMWRTHTDQPDRLELLPLLATAQTCPKYMENA